MSAAARRLIRQDVVLLLLGLLALAGAARLLLLWVLPERVPAWFSEELPPLFRHVASGEPVDRINQRQFGVVTFLVFEPAIRLVGTDLEALQAYGAVIATAAYVSAVAILARLFFRGSARRALTLAIVAGNFAPASLVLAQRQVDAWQVLCLSGSLALFASGKVSRLSGIPLAFGTLTKLLPIAMLAFLIAAGRWRAFALGAAVIVLLLGIGQVLYGPLMGFGYPGAIIAASGDTVTQWSTHHENNSLRGLIFKVAAGFRVAGGRIATPPELTPGLNLLTYALSGAIAIHLAAVSWRRRDSTDPRVRALLFCLGISAMLLVSPHTAHEYLIMTLPIFALLLDLYWTARPSRWPAWLSGVALVGLFAIGIFVPVSLIAGLVGAVLYLAQISMPEGVALTGSAIGLYDLVGIPGVGLVLTWIVLAVLERRWALIRRIPPADRLLRSR